MVNVYTFCFFDSFDLFHFDFILLNNFVVEQITAYIEKINIKESAFRVLETEFSDAQKYIDKLNQEKTMLKTNTEK